MQDLSELLKGFPSTTGGLSMANANSISTPPPFSAPGSESEQVHGIEAVMPGPVVPLPPMDDHTLINDEVHPAAPYQFTEPFPDDSTWLGAPNEDSAGCASSAATNIWRKV